MMTTVRTRSWIGLFAVAALCLTPAHAADGQAPPSPPKPAPRPKPCATPEFRQFDFWIGDWSVADPQGHAVGKNVITLEHDGCVLAEHWTGAAGGTGSSFNLYDAASKRWHQTWV